MATAWQRIGLTAASWSALRNGLDPTGSLPGAGVPGAAGVANPDAAIPGRESAFLSPSHLSNPPESMLRHVELMFSLC